MILTHFSEHNFKFEKTKVYSKPKKDSPKPIGLWLSDESKYGWSSWCQDKVLQLKKLTYSTEFVINTSKILQLDDINRVIKFCRYFQQEDNHLINWCQVRSTYSGVLISPFIAEARFKHLWYSTWDCASACVWDLSAVISVKSTYKTDLVKIKNDLSF